MASFKLTIELLKLTSKSLMVVVLGLALVPAACSARANFEVSGA